MCKYPDVGLTPQRRTIANLFLKRKAAMKTIQVVETTVCKLLSKRTDRDNHKKHDLFPKWQRDIGLYHRDEIQIGDLLGQGAFSVVHQVTDFQITNPHHRFNDEEVRIREMQRTSCIDGTHMYAIKHLKSDLGERRFRQAASDLVLEGKFLASLSHPFILKVHGWAADGMSSFADRHDGYFLIMDKIDETLSTRMSRWQQDQTYGYAESTQLAHYTEKIKIAFHIASALEYLHKNRIVFRDLKPDNVGFKGEGTTQLFDFGLCRELPEGRRNDENVVYHMSAVGTRRYMAPETVMRTGYNLKVDVYSWAMVLYEMLKLKRPYELYDREVHKILVCEGGQRPCLEPYWPSGVRDLLSRAWAQSPFDRPSMTEVIVALEPLLNVAEVEIMSPSARSLKAVYEMADLFSPRPPTTTAEDRTESTETYDISS